MNYGAYEVPVIANGSARATVAGEYWWESRANGQRGVGGEMTQMRERLPERDRECGMARSRRDGMGEVIERD